MAKCAKCNKRRLFLKLDNNGLCFDCQLKKVEEEREKHRTQIKLRKRTEEQKRHQNIIRNAINNIPTVDIISTKEIIKDRALYELKELKYSNITPKGKYPEFVVIDTETTGISAAKNKIVELCAVRFKDSIPTEMFITLINPLTPIPLETTKVHGITNEMVENSPTVKQIIKSFDSFVGASNIVAHNLDFDLRFIHKAGSSLIDTKRKYFCTMQQAQKLLKKPKVKWDKEYEFYDIDDNYDFDVENYKLGTLCDYFGIAIPDQHRAKADAFCAGLLFLQLINFKQTK